jgi:UBA/TS-N domain
MSESLSANTHLSQLKAMGFNEADCIEALRRTNNDVNHAVELISSGKGMCCLRPCISGGAILTKNSSFLLTNSVAGR